MTTEKEKRLLGLIDRLKYLDDLSLRYTIEAINNLIIEFGLMNSIQKKECVDKHNNAIPWYTYPAIEYIKQLDFSDKRIFEYGSGNSSKFWAKLAKEIVSVEHDKEWYENCLKNKTENSEIQPLKTISNI